MYDEDDYLMLSGIQHFKFCRRQWALIHIEQQWEENYHTTKGELFHKNAHNEESREKRGNTIIYRGLNVSSPTLGISGQCDIVEFHKSENGIHLRDYEDLWLPVPVEYKKGQPKDDSEDELQLCAQAMCLEEMLLTEIEKGYLFYGENRRRTEVIFTETLRNEVKNMTEEMHQLYKKSYTPKVKTSKKCNSCSLKNICLPKVQKGKNVAKYIDDMIYG